MQTEKPASVGSQFQWIWRNNSYIISNLTNLHHIELSNNRFSGKIPTSSIASLTSLVHFSVINNSLSGLLTPGSFAHLSKLKVFELSNNNLEVETEYPPWNSTFQLTGIWLSNWKLNKRAGVIPNFLYNQHDLRQVDLPTIAYRKIFRFGC